MHGCVILNYDCAGLGFCSVCRPGSLYVFGLYNQHARPICCAQIYIQVMYVTTVLAIASVVHTVHKKHQKTFYGIAVETYEPSDLSFEAVGTPVTFRQYDNIVTRWFLVRQRQTPKQSLFLTDVVAKKHKTKYEFPLSHSESKYHPRDVFL